MQAYRSVLDEKLYIGIKREERIHTTKSSPITHLETCINNTEHIVDMEQLTESEDEKKVWAYYSANPYICRYIG